jgi:hypothetical protein
LHCFVHLAKKSKRTEKSHRRTFLQPVADDPQSAKSYTDSIRPQTRAKTPIARVKITWVRILVMPAASFLHHFAISITAAEEIVNPVFPNISGFFQKRFTLSLDRKIFIVFR